MMITARHRRRRAMAAKLVTTVTLAVILFMPSIELPSPDIPSILTFTGASADQ